MESLHQNSRDLRELCTSSSPSDRELVTPQDGLQGDAFAPNVLTGVMSPNSEVASPPALQHHVPDTLGIAPLSQNTNDVIYSQDESARAQRRSSPLSETQGDQAATESIKQGTEKENSQSSRVWGKSDVYWREDLSENGRKLYSLLVQRQGDRDLLPSYAQEDEFDLDAAIDELRNFGLLDEADPQLFKLVSKKL